MAMQGYDVVDSLKSKNFKCETKNNYTTCYTDERYKLFPDYISSKKDASTYLQKEAYCYQLIKDLETSEVSQTQKAQV